MQVAIIARDGGNELADKIYRAVVSDELSRMQAKHARQIDDLTEAHKMTENRLSDMYKLARIAKNVRGNWWYRFTQHIATAWAMLWGMMLEIGLITHGKEIHKHVS